MSVDESLLAQSSSVRLRRTREDDLEIVTRLEQDEENRSFIMPWKRELHLEALTNPDLAHLIIETSQEGRTVGFMLLAGRENAHRSIEFRRIVVADKGKGYGRAAFRLMKRQVFEQWHAHRLWLDVFDYNQKARYLYSSEGFSEEGLLRECFSTGDQFASLVIMSLLAHEYVRE